MLIYDYDDDDDGGVASKHTTFKNGNVRDGL
jgi:hypothetical protein